MMKRCLFPSLALIITITSVSSSSTETLTHRYLRGSGNFMTRGLEECGSDCGCAAIRSSSCNSTEGELSYVAPTGNNGIINATDGEIGEDEWDLDRCGVPMYEAGNANTKDQLSQAWIDWNCATNTLCILIKTLNQTEKVIKNEGDSERWFQVSKKKLSPTLGWTNIFNGSEIIAVEGCYTITQEVTCIEAAEIHVNMVPAGSPTAAGATSSTGSKNGSGKIAMKLKQCTSQPSLSPSSSGQPSSWPSANPTNSPKITPHPSILATPKPSKANDGITPQPTKQPSRSPTQKPSLRPSQSAAPSSQPSLSPSSSGQPSSVPSASPSLSSEPSSQPSLTPSQSAAPSSQPSLSPSSSGQPSSVPSEPSSQPSLTPSQSAAPSSQPSLSPSSSGQPSSWPSSTKRSPPAPEAISNMPSQVPSEKEKA
eukprot:scaffold7339_cov111-Skeletonema_marinoi.AAC.1